jgi:hypothetical protein
MGKIMHSLPFFNTELSTENWLQINFLTQKLTEYNRKSNTIRPLNKYHKQNYTFVPSGYGK